MSSVSSHHTLRASLSPCRPFGWWGKETDDISDFTICAPFSRYMKYIIEDSVPVNHVASLETDFRV